MTLADMTEKEANLLNGRLSNFVHNNQYEQASKLLPVALLFGLVEVDTGPIFYEGQKNRLALDCSDEEFSRLIGRGPTSTEVSVT